MKKHCFAVLTLACLCPAFLFAEGKVGYVDIERITSKAKAVTNVMSDIQDEIKTLQKEINDKEKQMQELQADLKKTDGVFTKEETSKKKKDLDRLLNEYEDLQTRSKKKMRVLDETTFAPLMKKILFAIQDVAKERKFDVVLRGEAVLYGTTGADLTDDVIKKLNQDYLTTGSKQAKPESGKSDSSKREAARSDAAKAETSSSPAPDTQKSESAKETPSISAEPAKETPAEPVKETPAAKSEKKPSNSKGTKGTRPVDRQPD